MPSIGIGIGVTQPQKRSTTPGTVSTYLRPTGGFLIRRPDGTSKYKRPA